ncbi:MAG: glycosyltransferase [Aquificae bacterium]|nr:glycosyltransferase [Aquificota bacterium]
MKHGKILFITEEYSKNFYGVYTSIKQLSAFIEGNFEFKVLTPNTNNIWRYSRKFKKDLEKTISSFDVVHIHGVWQYPQYMGAKLAIKYRKPFIVSIHGMLEQWVMDIKNIGLLKYLKKSIYLRLFIQYVFKKAAVIHAITDLEKQSLKKYFPYNEIIVIPNAVDIKKIDEYLRKTKSEKPQKYILFVGRLHPKKGIELLIRTFNSLKIKDWKLTIIGPEEDKNYVNLLKKLSNGNKNIEFVGEVWGHEKFEFYRKAWVTVLPSYSETIGMVNLESTACYTPTITTFQTGLLNWEKSGGVLINPNVNELKQALKKIMSWSLEERINRGKIARQFVEKNFSRETVGKMWVKLYSNLINGG